MMPFEPIPATLDGNCGITTSFDTGSVAAAELPVACCSEGCMIVSVSGTKFFSESSHFQTCILAVGSVPGVAVAAFVDAGQVGPGPDYGFQLSVIVTTGNGIPIAFGTGIALVTPEEHLDTDWKLSISWCLNGQIRICFQNGTATQYVFFTDADHFMTLPLDLPLAYLVVPSGEAQDIIPSTITRVQVGCGSLSGGELLMLSEV